MDKQKDSNIKIPTKRKDNLLTKIKRNTILRNSANLSPLHYDYNFIFGSSTGTNSHSSRDNKNANEPKFKKLSPLIDLKAFHPHKYLKYEIQLHEQKKKYAPNRFFEEPIEISKSSFIREKYKNGNQFTPCLKIAKGQIFSTKKLVYCKHKFTTSRSKSSRESFEGSFSRFENKNNITNIKHSRPQTTRHLSLYSKNNSQMIKMSNLIDEVKEKNSDIIHDIYAERIYNKRFIPAKKIKPKSIDIKEIRNKLNLPDVSDDHIDQREILQNNYEKVKICLDEKSREYLRNIYKQINYEDEQLNRVCDIKDFYITNHQNLSKIKKQCVDVSKETVKIKKTIKGVYSILPLDESNSWNKMAKSMIHFDLGDSEYLEDLINKTNAMRTIKTVSKHKDLEMMYKAHRRSKRKMGIKKEELLKK